MGYFEDPKNREDWLNELRGLKAERERRASGGGNTPAENALKGEPRVGKEMAGQNHPGLEGSGFSVEKNAPSNPVREPITFTQLMAEEFGTRSDPFTADRTPIMDMSLSKDISFSKDMPAMTLNND